ncbi:MAG TPA: PadR family transcriptional regulator [Candidatus Sulfotelmatobacter sp.]|nr:PadR family transcriptional regulator [Candidatus Sulfotelmatobacter sp.]
MQTNEEAKSRLDLMQGTLDMLILRTLVLGPAHGHEIAKHIQRTTDDVLQVEHGSLYPALHRLERRGWVSAKWETPRGGKREFKYYRLTPAGKKRLITEHSNWRRIVATIGRVMEPTEEG